MIDDLLGLICALINTAATIAVIAAGKGGGLGQSMRPVYVTPAAPSA